MGTGPKMNPDSLTTELIAPCGMDCGVCIAHLRPRKPCGGCNDDDAKPPHCVSCHIKRCGQLAAGGQHFCFECSSYPCKRLRQLDKRYRAKYRMSMIENLDKIRQVGVEEFVLAERTRWRCANCGSLVSVHREDCPCCGVAAST